MPRRERQRNRAAEARLSEQAESEILEIYAYSVLRFGEYQAEAYIAGLQRTFGLLADFPQIGQDISALRPGVRRFRFQSHIILYSADADGVLIRSILHASRKIRPELFD